MDKKVIPLGSGRLYIMEFTGEVPDYLEIEQSENELGYISGGASLEYKPSFYTAKDDLGFVSRTIITEEESTLKSGLITWNGTTLNTLCSTGRITDKAGMRIVKIGGIVNNSNKSYVIHFRHIDESAGDIRLTIVGKNEAGFTLAFAKDKESTVDAEFKADTMDEEGTQILYQEECLESLIHVTSTEGTEEGKTKIVVKETKGNNNSYAYKTLDGVVNFPEVGEICDTGYTAWDGTSDITATNNKKILLVEIDGSSKAVKAGKAIVVVA